MCRDVLKRSACEKCNREYNGFVTVLLYADTRTGPLTLRAAGGDPLSAAEKTELLEKSLAGEPIELTVDIRPFSQEDGKPNRNHTRFRKGALTALGRSGKGSVFLRDHAQRDSMARGGTIIASKMVKEGDVHELHQTVQVVKPWAVQSFLDGTSDRFSIGWHPTGLVLCTACNASIGKCWHWPGDKVAQEDDTVITVEFEFQDAELVETSSVNVPAVTGTSVVDIRAALGLESKPRGERMPSKPPEKADPVDTKKLEQAAANVAKANERERATAIRRTGKALGLSAEFVEEHAAGDTLADDFRKLAEDEYEANRKPPVGDSGRPSISAGDSDVDKFRSGLTSALLMRMGSQVESVLTKKGHDFGDGQQYRSCTILDMARACLQRANISMDSKTKMQILGIANTLSSGYQATGDFTIAFEEAIHKALLARMELSEMTWRRFCRVGRVEDFRGHRRYRIGEMGTWEVVLENGEYKRLEIPDAVREIISATKRGNIIAITREAQINDDMDFITEQINAFVDGGLYTVEAQVYAFLAENGGLGGNLADGDPLFDASRNNITSGAAMSVTAFDADRVAMKRQRDDNDKRFLNIRPRTLVVPTELWGTATVINGSEFDQDEVGPNLTNKFRVPNKVRGLFNDIVDAPELSGTRRYIFADPMIAPAIEVAFLEGVETPTVETRDGWTVDGTEMKGRYEFGVAGRDGRGAITNAGA